MKHYAALPFLCLLAACGGGNSEYSPYGGTEKPTAIKIGKPYTINGKTYAPSYQPAYQEVGTASWYGPGFHGRMTASGERFNTSDVTAAHPTLPMPSFVRVTRIDSGKSVVVRVNDRGPFHSNRVIDLSKGAAEKIGLIRDGKATVRVEYLPDETEQYIASLGLDKPAEWYGIAGNAATSAPSSTSVTSVQVADLAPTTLQEQAGQPYDVASAPSYVAPASPSAVAVPPKPPGSPPSFSMNFISDAEALPATPPRASVNLPVTSTGTGHYRIQVGAFGLQENADRLAGSINDIAPSEVRAVTANGRTMYRVLLGREENSGAANSVLEQVKSRGYRDARIIVE